eukprot:6444010-Amphidinium_carterae.1
MALGALARSWMVEGAPDLKEANSTPLCLSDFGCLKCVSPWLDFIKCIQQFDTNCLARRKIND